MMYVGSILAALTLGLAFHAWKKKLPVSHSNYILAALCWFITDLAFLIHKLVHH